MLGVRLLAFSIPIRRLARCRPDVAELAWRVFHRLIRLLFRLDLMLQIQALQAGDVLLYRATGLYGRLISFHSGSEIGHVEVYVGGGFSVASRDRLGVERYPLRTADLMDVLRPTTAFDLDAALDWFEQSAKGQPYSWTDLLAFVRAADDWDTRGWVCSPFAAAFLRIGGIPVFAGVPVNKIMPRDFRLIPELLADVTATVGVSATGTFVGSVPAPAT
jgi:hypothetical protein